MLKKAIIFFVVVLFCLFLLGFFLLKNGIKIDNLSFANVNFSQLYLKLDKKLIFTLKSIDTNSSDKDSDTDMDITPSNIFWIYQTSKIFDLVRIDDLVLNKKHIFVEFKNKKLYIKDEEGEATLSINIKDDDILFNLLAKSFKYDFKIEGDLKAKLSSLSSKVYKPIATLTAFATHKDSKVVLNGKLKNGILEYKIDSNEIKDLNFIKDFITLTPQTSKLIFDDLSFESIKINNISGTKNLKTLSGFDIKSLKANFLIKNLDFKYEKYPNINQKTITADLKEGKLKVQLLSDKQQNNVSLEGNIVSKVDTKSVDLDAHIFYKDIDIKALINISDDILHYSFSSNKFKDIKEIQTFIDIPKNIKKWTIDRLDSKAVKIDDISGNIYLKDFLVDLSTLSIKVKLYDILLDFNPNKAYPLTAELAYVYFDGKDISLKFKKLRSNDVDLKGSNATIYNVLGQHNGIILRLQSISPINWTLVRVAKSYGAHIPNDIGLRQLKGSSKVKVKINIPFSKAADSIYVKVDNKDSVVKIKDKIIDLKKFSFLYKDSKIWIKNTIGKYENYNIDLKDLFFDIKRNDLNLNLSAYDDNKTFSFSLKNEIDFNTHTTEGNVDIKFIDIKDKVSVKNEIIPFNAKYKDNIHLQLPTLGVVYKKQKDNYYLKVDELKKFEKFIPPLQEAGIKSSSLEVESYKLKDMDIDLIVSGAMDLNKTYDIELKSNINLDQNTTEGFLRIYDLKYDDKVALDHKDIPFKSSFGEDINLTLPTLTLNYKKVKNTHSLDIKDISKVASLLKVVENYGIPKGNIYVETKDFKNLDAKLNLDVSKYSIFYKKKKQNKLSLNVKVKDLKDISIKDTKNMLKADINIEQRPVINIFTKNLGYEHKSSKTKKKKKNKYCKYIKLDLPIINLNMKNGYVKYEHELYNYDSLDLDTNQQKLDFKYKDDNKTIEVNLDRYKVDIKAKNLDKEFLNNSAGFNAIDSGSLDINASGTQCNIDGKVVFDNVNVKDAAVLTKMFALVNSTPGILNPYLLIPSAVRLVEDGFALNDYKINEGEVIFHLDRDKQILDLSKVTTIGAHNSFYGSAVINLDTKTIESTTDVSFMQGMAKVISYIPMVGYWILGDNERFSYMVNVRGDINDPEIETHITRETFMAPVNFIKRVVTYPAKLISYIVDNGEEDEEED